MYVIVNSLKYRLVAAAVSLVIFGVIYFTVIRPDNNTANNAVVQGEKQLQQAVSNASKAAGSSNAQAATVLTKAQKLTNCVAAAGTNTSAIQLCQQKYAP